MQSFHIFNILKHYNTSIKAKLSYDDQYKSYNRSIISFQIKSIFEVLIFMRIRSLEH